MTPEPVPTDLLRRARHGDHAAYEELYRRYVGRVYAIIFRLEPDEALAEELTQDAFIKAWRGLEGFRGESALSTWLYRLAVNVVLGHRRAAGRRGRRFLATDDVEAFASPRAATPPESGLAMDLEYAISGLPPGARAVFVLHDVEGFPHEEIGTLLGIATGTSKAQLFRARRLLREVLR